MLADTEEVALSFENTNTDSNQAVKTDRIRHPITVLFHLLFRSAAILLFLFSTIIFSNFITIFVIIILFLSMDFWTTKNISGRLLVGLRWWNYIDNDGKSHWVFESRKNNEQTNKLTNQIIVQSSSETRIFWSSLILTQLIWTLFFVISFLTFKFKWLTIILVAFVLNGSNLYGFLRCKFGSQQNMSNMASDFIGKQMVKSLFERMTKSQNETNSNSNKAEQNI